MRLLRHLKLTRSASQPDLPLRLAKGIPLTKGNRDTYYIPGPEGYTDYPFAEEGFAKL